MARNALVLEGSGSSSLEGFLRPVRGPQSTEATSAKGFFEMQLADWCKLKACSSMTLTFQPLRFARRKKRRGSPCLVCIECVGCVSTAGFGRSAGFWYRNTLTQAVVETRAGLEKNSPD